MRKLFAAILSMLVLSGCGDRITYRYRLSVEVMNSGVVHKGSSVLEVSHEITSGFMTESGPRDGAIVIKGEAITVDLGARGILFVLPETSLNSYGSIIPELLFGNRQSNGAPKMNSLAELKGMDFPHIKGVREVPAEYWPTMARFRSVLDRTTIEQVDPQNLPGQFGFGVKILRVTAEITRDPVTFKIQNILPWLSDKSKRGVSLGGDNRIARAVPARFENIIYPGTLQRGLE